VQKKILIVACIGMAILCISIAFTAYAMQDVEVVESRRCWKTIRGETITINFQDRHEYCVLELDMMINNQFVKVCGHPLKIATSYLEHYNEYPKGAQYWVYDFLILNKTQTNETVRFINYSIKRDCTILDVNQTDKTVTFINSSHYGETVPLETAPVYNYTCKFYYDCHFRYDCSKNKTIPRYQTWSWFK